jgi:hypothetical protein
MKASKADRVLEVKPPRSFQREEELVLRRTVWWAVPSPDDQLSNWNQLVSSLDLAVLCWY